MDICPNCQSRDISLVDDYYVCQCCGYDVSVRVVLSLQEIEAEERERDERSQFWQSRDTD